MYYNQKSESFVFTNFDKYNFSYQLRMGNRNRRVHNRKVRFNGPEALTST